MTLGNEAEGGHSTHLDHPPGGARATKCVNGIGATVTTIVEVTHDHQVAAVSLTLVESQTESESDRLRSRDHPPRPSGPS
jgi:hypothetical protein